MPGPRTALAIASAVAVLAGCGSSTAKQALSAQSSPAADPPQVAKTGNANQVRLIASPYGRVLADGRRRALYLFTADRGGRSSCSGACAATWPPYIVKVEPEPGAGAKARLIGTTRRSDGRLQATYRGHPLYYYVGDRSPGQINCQAAVEFGGYWYVLRATGDPVH
jgi:predicted lipoprotein with Yx(FWY)xxD motif